MSVWSAVQDVTENYPAWPQPFECQLRSFKWWHCGEHHTLDVKTVAGCFGHFWWSEIFPSLQEFTRVQITGKARCGLGFKTKQKNPLSPIWGDSISLNRTRIVSSMISPVTTVFFFWWATGAVMSAAEMAHSMMYVEEAGEQTPNTILIPARQSLYGLAELDGGLLTDEALCTQILTHPNNSNFIESPDPGVWNSLIVGTINTQSWTVDNLDVYFRTEFDVIALINFSGLGPNTVVPWSLEITQEGTFGHLEIRADILQHGGAGLSPTIIAVDRWMAEWHPTPWDDGPCNNGSIMAGNSEQVEV